MAIISVINQKGGVAKTTTSVNVASSWSKQGRSVLLIDLDPQASATKAIFGDQEFDKTIYDVIVNRVTAEETVVHSESFGIDVIPSEIMLSGVDIQIAAHFGRERILKKKLETIKKKYDAIIIDCPPSLGLITINALMASRDIVIPICPEYFSAKGIELILETLRNIQVGLGHRVGVKALLSHDLKIVALLGMLLRKSRWITVSKFLKTISQTISLWKKPITCISLLRTTLLKVKPLKHIIA